jgi:hypothetical protein
VRISETLEKSSRRYARTSLPLSVICSNNAQVGFKSFLNITPNVTHSAPPSAPLPGSRPASTPVPPLSAAGSSFMLTLDENPLAEFVELPEDALEGGLWFSNVLCGVLRGSLEMVSLVKPSLDQSVADGWDYRFRCRSRQNLYQTC